MFAQGLARDWGFVDMATEVLDDLLADGAALSAKQRQRVDLVRCEVLHTGAQRETEDKARRDALAAAAEAFHTYSEDYSGLDGYLDGLVLLAELQLNRGVFLRGLLEDADWVDARDELVSEAKSALDEALRSCSAVMNEVDLALDEAVTDEDFDALRPQRILRVRAYLAKGRSYRARGMLFGPDSTERELDLQDAYDTLDDYVLDIGETNRAGLFGFLAMGEVLMDMGDVEGALEFFEHVGHEAIPSDPEMRAQLTEAEIHARFGVVEYALRLAMDTCNADGRTERALEIALDLDARRLAEGVPPAFPEGHMATLSAAVAHLNSGDDATALKLAKEVLRRNRTNVLKIEAQKVIGRIMSNPDAQVSAADLFEAAQGRYSLREFNAAIASFKRMVRTADPARDADLLARAWWTMGQCYALQGRYEEAAAAYGNGRDEYGDVLEWVEKNAKSAMDAYTQLLNVSGRDPYYAGLRDAAERRFMAVSTSSQGAIYFQKGKKAYSDRDYPEAIDKFARVNREDADYERALVYIAVCHYKQKDMPEAARLLHDYADRYVDDPLNALAVEDQSGQAKREDALAMARYYLAQIGFKEAKAEPEGASRTAALRALVAPMDAYPLRFPTQVSYVPSILLTLIQVHARLDDIEAARVTFRILEDGYPGSKYTSNAAYSVWSLMADKVAALEAAAQAAPEDQRTHQEWLEALRDRTSFLTLYNAGLARPSYKNLRAESSAYLKLHDWGQAQRVLRATLSAYEASQGEVVVKYVYPELARTLMEGEPPQLAEAEDLMVAAVRLTPTRANMEAMARILGGWVDWPEGGQQPERIVQGTADSGMETALDLTPPEGQPAYEDPAARRRAAVDLWRKIWQGWPAADKFSYDYFLMYFRQSNCYLGGDERQQATAERMIEGILDDHADGWLDKFGSAGKRSLDARFSWLQRRLRELNR